MHAISSTPKDHSDPFPPSPHSMVSDHDRIPTHTIVELRDKLLQLTFLATNQESEIKHLQCVNDKLMRRVHELEDESDARIDSYTQAYEQKLAVLEARNAQVEDEINHLLLELEAVKASRAVLDNELEDLSRQLFEQANHMVAAESRKRASDCEDLNRQILQLQAVVQHEKRARGTTGDLVMDLDLVDPRCLDAFVNYLVHASGGDLRPNQVLETEYFQLAVDAEIRPCLSICKRSPISLELLITALANDQVCVYENGQLDVFGDRVNKHRLSSDSGIISDRTKKATNVCCLCTESLTNQPTYTMMLHTLDMDNSQQFPICAFCNDRVYACEEFIRFTCDLAHDGGSFLSQQNLTKVWAKSLFLKSQILYARLGCFSAHRQHAA